MPGVAGRITGGWAGTRVAVTGAGGFIGSHLVERLLELGATVRAFVRYTSRNDNGLLTEVGSAAGGALEIVRGDIRDPNAVLGLLDGADVVFHLAALVGIPYSYDHVDEVVAVNVGGTANVLNAARTVGTGRVVVTSTSEVYGSAQFVPMHEGHPKRPQSPYAATKVAADALAESFAAAFGMAVSVVRPFNTFGPRQSDRALIPTIVCQALAGDEITLGNVAPRRDFTFVTDTVAGFLAVATSEAAVGQQLNVGSGSDVSVLELVQTVGSLLGRELRVVTSAERMRPPGSEVDQLLADAGRVNELTGWKPAVTLDEGLDRTIDWIRRHPDRYSPGDYRA